MPHDCDGTEPPTWQVTGSVAGFSTTIDFDAMRVSVEQLAVTATVGRFATPRFGWTASAGGILGGTIDDRTVTGGATIAGSINWLIVYERERRPFVALTGSLGTSYVRAIADDLRHRTWWAIDARAGAMVGKTFADRWVPYAAARVFGGPVFWELSGASATGNDRYHVTLGAGLIVRLPRDADISVEVMPLGEQSAALGVTLRL